VAGLYGAVDAFVLPSRRESYGTVYGEAMAAGLPVVGWRAGNLPHLAGHEVEGLIVEAGDVSGLTEALARLAGDAPLRRRLGEAPRRRAAALPTWNDSTALIVASLREVVERERGRGALR
jgi:glycosyltransferase involved in cell wall biosynthesis